MTSSQKRRMTWTAIVGGLAAASTIASFALGGAKGLARAAAAEKVAPVAERVTKLEVQRAEDVKKIDEMRADIKTLLRRVPAQ